MNDQIRAALLRDGAEIVGALPDNAIMIAAEPSFAPKDLPLAGTDELQAQDKVSPLVGTPADTASYIVEFYPDVNREDAEALLIAEGFTPINNQNLNPQHFLIRAAIDDLPRLSRWDQVAYIFPAPAEMLEGERFQNCAGALTEGLPVGQYVIMSGGWARDSSGNVKLGYTFGDLTQKVDSSIVRSEILRAMGEWSKVARVQFTPAQSAAAARTISIKFATRAHDDGNPFDGPGGTLGHTFYPANPEPIAGDVHLDGDEAWHAGTNVDVYTVALHELGHALGLGHSDRPGAIMYPYYKYPAQLGIDDIAGIQALYGTPSGSSGTPTTTSTFGTNLSLSIDSPSSGTVVPADSLTVAVAGTTANGSGPIAVTWQTNHGASGIATGSTSWTEPTVPVAATGSTTITITATDASLQSVTKSVTVSKAPTTTPDTTPPTLSIVSPAMTGILTSNSTIAITGTAADNIDVLRVTWQSGVNSGTASGTRNWSVSGIPLLLGTNTIVVRAYDAAGNSGWRSLSVTRR